jgi:glycosyltransferase involved in cell wall biosynthesis
MIVVIPCYNESERLDLEEVRLLLQSGIHLLFVNDGSTDSTQSLLDDLASQNPGVVIAHHLSANSGKGEAVRQGLLKAIGTEEPVVGFADADFATPAREILRLAKICRDGTFEVVLGSRVKLLGLDIQRRLLRHYLGRIFATCASIVLRLPVYDTQCGAKFFKVTPALRESLAQPFHSRWAFDVELIGRLLTASVPAPLRGFAEVPLGRWRDVRGSKLGAMAMVKAVMDLWRISRELSRRRKSK